MPDFLDTLAQTAKESISEAYYEDITPATAVPASLKRAIMQKTGAAIITEIKATSPSMGTMRKNFTPHKLAKAMARGGAVGISILTEPKHFRGSLSYLTKVRETVSLPLLMKDIIVNTVQLDAAVQAGANAVLLIQALFDRGYCEPEASVMVAEAHKRNLEVLLEVHTKEEFNRAAESAADLVGVNNRDLRTLKVDLNVTRDVLADGDAKGRIIVSESGVNSASDVSFLRRCGANAFLVGSALMLADNVEAKVRELVHAQ